MKSIRSISFASVAAMVVLSGGVRAGEATESASQDANGRKTLGVDISNAGSTPARVGRFMISLPADAAAKVRTGCAVVMDDPANHHAALLRFCTALPQRSVSLP